MSLFSYEGSKRAAEACDDFDGLVMAAMRRAGGENLRSLIAAFPNTYAELDQRYNAPLGLLPGERNSEGWRCDEEGNIYDPTGKLAG